MKNKILVSCNFNPHYTIEIDNTHDSDLLSVGVNTQFSHGEILFDITKEEAKNIVGILNQFIHKQ